jgi:hypothetical protein
MKIAIIGGGPSGLVTLKTLLEVRSRFDVQIEPVLFESDSESQLLIQINWKLLDHYYFPSFSRRHLSQRIRECRARVIKAHHMFQRFSFTVGKARLYELRKLS